MGKVMVIKFGGLGILSLNDAVDVVTSSSSYSGRISPMMDEGLFIYIPLAFIVGFSLSCFS